MHNHEEQMSSHVWFLFSEAILYECLCLLRAGLSLPNDLRAAQSTGESVTLTARYTCV